MKWNWNNVIFWTKNTLLNNCKWWWNNKDWLATLQSTSYVNKNISCFVSSISLFSNLREDGYCSYYKRRHNWAEYVVFVVVFFFVFLFFVFICLGIVLENCLVWNLNVKNYIKNCLMLKLLVKLRVLQETVWFIYHKLFSAVKTNETKLGRFTSSKTKKTYDDRMV